MRLTVGSRVKKEVREQRNKAYFLSKITSFVGSVAYEIPAKMP